MGDPANAHADGLRGSGLKDLTLPGTEVPVVIRKVLLIEVLGLGLLPTIQPEEMPGAAEPSRAERFRREAEEKQTEEWTLAQELELRLALLRLGLVDPVLWEGSPLETPEGALHFTDLAEHMDWLVGEVISFSGIATGGVDLRPFPGDSASGGAGQTGEKVRAASE